MRPLRTAKRQGESGGEQGFWPSYADMMSAVALILFFLMLLSYIQNLITGNDLQNTQELLAATKSQVEEAQAKLSVVSADLELAGSQLEEAQKTLDLQQQEIAGYAATLEEQADQLASQSKLLGEQDKLIAQQKDYLLAADEEIKDMRSQMQTIAVLRLSILEQIKDSLTKSMGSGTVSIGDNGNIILSESVLFDVGSSEVKDDSNAALTKLANVLYTFLKNPENSKYVDSIVISGHTDSTGGDAYNRELSTQRANAVLDCLLSGNLSRYSSYFCAAGYGATRPVADNSTEEGRAANRRIEISIILKDDTVMQIVESYLSLDVPEVNTGAAG